MEETWKPITEVPIYEVSSLGRIRTQKGQLRQLTPGRAGYVQIALYKSDGNYVMRLVHRLVALEFVPNPSELPQVNHKDGNRSNNQFANLEWVDPKTNSATRMPTKHKTRERAVVQLTLAGEVVRVWDSTKAAAAEMKVSRGKIQACLVGKNATSKGFRWIYQDDYEVDPDEEWRELKVQEALVQVSSFGRIRLPTGQISAGALQGDGYRNTTVGGAHFRVHRLVALAFIPQTDILQTIVNHKDGDPGNNRASNLEWVTHRENTAHAVRTGRMRVTPVLRTGGGMEDKEYSSMAAAGIDTGIAPQNISRCVCRGLSAGGFQWTLVPEKTDLAAASAPELPPQKSEPLVQCSSSIPDNDAIWKELGLDI